MYCLRGGGASKHRLQSRNQPCYFIQAVVVRQRYSHYASVIAQSQIFNQSAGVEIAADCDPVLIQ